MTTRASCASSPEALPPQVAAHCLERSIGIAGQVMKHAEVINVRVC